MPANLMRFFAGYGAASLLVSALFVWLSIRHAYKRPPTSKPDYPYRMTFTQTSPDCKVTCRVMTHAEYEAEQIIMERLK
jgi:hypothetical protein